jgi:RND family efflux transporter MFP subunit
MDSIGDRKVLRLALACAVPASLVAAAATYAMTNAPGDAAAPDAASAEASAPAVLVERAAERAISCTVFATGSLTAREEVLVGVQVQVDGMRLHAVLVEAGDYVQKGQVMATLDRAVLLARLDQQDAEIARANAGIAQAKAAIVEAEASERETAAALLRASELARRDIVSQEKLEQSKAAPAVASARLDAQRQNWEALRADKLLAQAKRRETALSLSRTQVTAPESGLVAAKSAKVGQAAGLSEGPLFRIIRDGDIELEAEIIDRDLSFLAVGQSVEASIAAFADIISGKVRLIDPVVDQRTRLAKVRVALDCVPGLRPGLFVRVKIEMDTRRAIVIPRSELQAEPGHDHSVKVVENGIARTRKVVTGLSDRGGIEILAGLSGGELVVSRAGSFLRDGNRVTPHIASKLTAGRKTQSE